MSRSIKEKQDKMGGGEWKTQESLLKNFGLVGLEILVLFSFKKLLKNGSLIINTCPHNTENCLHKRTFRNYFLSNVASSHELYKLKTRHVILIKID